MKPSDAVATLRRFNAWRRDDGDSDQPDPREIGLAIDALCDHAERLTDANEDMRDLLREVYNLTQLERDCPVDLPHRALVHIGHLIEEKTPPDGQSTETTK